MIGIYAPHGFFSYALGPLFALMGARSHAARHVRDMPTPLARVVSKKKNRYTEDGFDLDLSFVTDRLIAMGFPSVGIEACYRNPASQVRCLLARLAREGHQCKCYNLCAEPSRTYSPALLGLSPTLCERHGTYDHCPCPLALIAPFCRSVDAYLAEDASHVVAVHCKAGKGRTGMMLCMYLVWSGQCASGAESARLYGERRTRNGKGVTIPSQHRYIRYTEAPLVRGGPAVLSPPLLQLVAVRLLHAPAAAVDPAVNVRVELVRMEQPQLAGRNRATGSARDAPPWHPHEVYDHGKASARAAQSGPARAGRSFECLEQVGGSGRGGVNELRLECVEGAAPWLMGDVKVVVSVKGKTLCILWFHTAFAEGTTLRFGKSELDKARHSSRSSSSSSSHGAACSSSVVQHTV